jgi:hypothetical protein
MSDVISPQCSGCFQRVRSTREKIKSLNMLSIEKLSRPLSVVFLIALCAPCAIIVHAACSKCVDVPSKFPYDPVTGVMQISIGCTNDANCLYIMSQDGCQACTNTDDTVRCYLGDKEACSLLVYAGVCMPISKVCGSWEFYMGYNLPDAHDCGTDDGCPQ